MKPVFPYVYEFQPAYASENLGLYIQQQLSAVARGQRTLYDAVTTLDAATTAPLVLKPTGVQAGTYTNARIVVGLDGRISQIESRPGFALPPAPDKGYVLTSTAPATYAWSLPAVVQGLPGGGSNGQVLTRYGTSAIWTTPDSPTYAINQTPDIFGETVGTAFNLHLSPTGVSPGTYTNATITVDGNGRITTARAADPVQTTPTLYGGTPALPATRLWRIAETGGFSVTPLDVGAVVFRTSRDGEDLGGTVTRTEATVSVEFPSPVQVGAVEITATTASGAPLTFDLQSSEDGYFWASVAEALPQAAWEPGETRVFAITPGGEAVASEPANTANNPEKGRFEITPDEDVYFVYWTPAGYVGNIVAHHDSVKAGDGYEILAENGTDYIAQSV